MYFKIEKLMLRLNFDSFRFFRACFIQRNEEAREKLEIGAEAAVPVKEKAFLKQILD